MAFGALGAVGKVMRRILALVPCVVISVTVFCIVRDGIQEICRSIAEM